MGTLYWYTFNTQRIRHFRSSTSEVYAPVWIQHGYTMNKCSRKWRFTEQKTNDEWKSHNFDQSTHNIIRPLSITVRHFYLTNWLTNWLTKYFKKAFLLISNDWTIVIIVSPIQADLSQHNCNGCHNTVGL